MLPRDKAPRMEESGTRSRVVPAPHGASTDSREIPSRWFVNRPEKGEGPRLTHSGEKAQDTVVYMDDQH